MLTKTGILQIAGALLLIVGVTVAQGWLTDRWGEKQNDLLEVFASRLERLFPESFGDWTVVREVEIKQAELDRAGAVGSISRAYRNGKTKSVLSAFVVCATPHDASGHTPDRCYPGAGFEIAEPEHRETITLRDGRRAEAFTGTFAREGTTVRIFWTYGVPAAGEEGERPAADAPPKEAADGPPSTLAWVAPQIARIALNKYPAVYKLYAIIDQSKLAASRATAECADFLAEILPAFDAAIAADLAGEKPGEPAPPPESASPGGTAG